MGAHGNDDAPQHSQRDDARGPPELRRSKRIRAAVTASQRQPEAVINQDDAPSTISCCNQARQVTSNESAVPLTNAHTHTGTAQERLLPNRHEVPITAEPRRSKRIRALTSSQHDMAAPRPNATASHAHTAQPLRRSKRIRTAASSRHDTLASRPIAAASRAHSRAHTQAPPLASLNQSPARASLRRRHSQPLCMELRRPRTRQRMTQVTQPSLPHAHITESASERHSSISPHSPSGMPFDPG